MTNRVIGPGQGLPPPQALYPANLQPSGVPYTQGNNAVSLAPGQSVQIPAGDWMIDLGKYSVLEYQDPVEGPVTVSQTVGVWRPIRVQRGTFPIRSDGINFRISNLTGCAVAAVVTQGGTTYAQATATVTPSTGNSTWQAIVGGRLAPLSCSLAGSGYGLAPIVYIPAPPAPGVQATAVATINNGAINGFTMINEGAGYTVAPAITILPNPFDPTTSAITAAAAFTSLTGSGVVAAVLCTNSGAPVASTMTLSIAGGDHSCSISPVFLTTIANATVNAIGSGTFTAAALSTYGGIMPQTPAFKTPIADYTDFLPRQAQFLVGLTNANLTPGTISIIDGGMFVGTALPLVNVYGGTIQTAPTITLTQGSANDTVTIQPL